MALDIVGPANAPNSVTVRPADTRTFGAADTWFKDCSSPTSNDGTKIQAGFFNGFMAQLRHLIRGNGQTVGAVDIVTLDNADDDMALKAVQHLIQRGQVLYAADTGAVNAMVISPTPAIAEYKDGMRLLVKAAFAPTGPTTINVSAKGAKDVRNVTASLFGGEWLAGQYIELAYDGPNNCFQLVWIKQPGQPTFLTAPRTFFVNGSTGSDSNDGTTATVTGGHGPFATLARAATEVAKYNLNGFNITVNVANGTYAGVVLPAVAGAGSVLWVGDTTTPANVSIAANVSGSPAVNANGTAHNFAGFKVSNSSGSGVGITARGVLVLGNMEFGACAGPMTTAAYGATLRYNGTAYRITGSAADGAGGPGSFLYAYQGAIVETTNLGSPPTLTLTGTPNFQTAFLVAGGISSTFVIWTSIAGSGTGVRYSGDDISVIRVAGGGPTHYPGSSSGVLAHGAQYY